MFKINWEKASATYKLTQSVIQQMLQLVYPNEKLVSVELIKGGYANLNYKFWFQSSVDPMILRVYLQDEEAVYREQKLGLLLDQVIPAPLTYCFSKLNNHYFAITKFIPGIPLRELLLSQVPHDVRSIMHEVGLTLSKFTKYPFAQTGFFDKELKITKPFSKDNEVNFLARCLKNSTVLSLLNKQTLFKIRELFNQSNHLLPPTHEKHLVHGDFDPANILMREYAGRWQISGIVDFEFAFSGSVLWDISTMLRYAHNMPLEFQQGFLEGIKFGGVKLPNRWEITLKRLNIISLLDLLTRSNPSAEPNKCHDICELIHFMIEMKHVSKFCVKKIIVPYQIKRQYIFYNKKHQ